MNNIILSRKKQKKIKLGEKTFLVLDLTEPLRLDVEVYPGDPKPEKKIFSEFNETGYEHHIYSLSDHNFHPHGDALKHQNIDLKSKGIEIFDIDFCFNKACLIGYVQ